MPRTRALSPIFFLLAFFCAVQIDAIPPALPEDLSEEVVGEISALGLLGAWPLCEASALITSPWNHQLALVADNELDQQLFGFLVQSKGLVPQGKVKMPGGKRPRDIEAFAQVGNVLLVVGSHSRSSSCEERPNRQRLRLLESDSKGLLKSTHLIDSKETWNAARVSKAKCVATLFTDPPPALAEAVCKAIVEAEELAAEGSSCPVLNIEGAFGTEEGRVWLGLRAPLADGRAMLLRLTPALDALRFDKATFLDLEGRGIRELTREGEAVYGIAGPTEDSSDLFALFSVELGQVNTGGRLQPKILRRDLQTSSEGIMATEGGLLIVVDGAEGRGKECASPSQQYLVEFP